MPQHGGTRAAVSLWECIRNECLKLQLCHTYARMLWLLRAFVRGDRALVHAHALHNDLSRMSVLLERLDELLSA